MQEMPIHLGSYMDSQSGNREKPPLKQAGEPHADQPGLKWLSVAGMGIAFSVSGNFSGWNAGLGIGGWGGMLVAALVMACFYLCLTQCVAELASACPPGSAEGMDSFAAVGLGASGRFFAGISVAAAVGTAVGITASFIEAYCLSVFGIGGATLKVLLIAAFMGIQLRGTREAVFLTMAGGFVAVVVLLFFCMAMVPGFSMSALYTSQNGAPTLFPHGVGGVMQCIPYALFMFLGVEQAANAAGDMHEPMKNLPRAIFVSTGAVLLLGLSVLVCATGAGVEIVAAAEGNPLFIAITHSKSAFARNWLETAVGIGSMVSLLATAFSLFYASSRQFFSLAKAGYLPPSLATVNRKGAPSHALLLVGLLATIGTQIDPDTVLVCFIFCLSVCNGLVLVSFLRARAKLPHLARPYRAIGGRLSAFIALILAALVLLACVQLQLAALEYVAFGYGLAALYYITRIRRSAWA